MSILINLIYTRLYPIVYPHILLVLHPIWRVALVLEARLFLKGKRHQRHLIANERATLICLQLKVRWETVWKCGIMTYYDHPKMLENGKWINQMTIQKCWNMGNSFTNNPFCGDKLPGFENFFQLAGGANSPGSLLTWAAKCRCSRAGGAIGSAESGDWLTHGWPIFSQRWLTVDWPFWVNLTAPKSPSCLDMSLKMGEVHLGMDQYLLIPFLGGWTSIYQLFWCSPGVQGFDTLHFSHVRDFKGRFGLRQKWMLLGLQASLVQVSRNNAGLARASLLCCKLRATTQMFDIHG